MRCNLSPDEALFEGARSREDGMRILSDAFFTKKQIEQLARNLEVFIMKQDTLETLKGKIVDATIGARLRSAAIKDDN